ncbi:MAG: TonB-dependent receptor [Gemmatimonadaceae bacterium]|nr:TonB-dependent receptor [Gemmatimonadaceae bacterium]
MRARLSGIGLCAIVLFALSATEVEAQAGARDSLRADSAAQLISAVRISASRVAGIIGGAAAVVIKPDQLRASPAPLLDQALRESPFVLVRQNSRGEMEISVRGSDSRQAAVLLDGVPLTLGWDHRTDPSLIPITGTERIVIVRGLGSLLNGPNTLGGSIEISHDAYGQPSRGQLWAGVGVDQYRASVATLGYGKRLAEFGGGALSFRAGAAHRQREGFKLPSGAPDPTAQDGLRTGTDFEQTDGFASLRWNNQRGRSIGVTYSAYDAARGVPPEEHISAPRFWRYPDAKRSIAIISANTGLFTSPLGMGTFEVGAGQNASNVRIETYSARDYATVNGRELGDERTVTARALLTHSVGPATLRASYTTADIRYEEILNTTAPADYRQKLSSGGVELDIPLRVGTQVTGGVVFDASSTPETGGRTPSQEPFDNTGWRFGVSHALNSKTRLHASASQRSRFPALRELYSGALNRFTPNPLLKPETLRGFEGGVTLNGIFPSLGSSTFQLVGFRHRLDDAVVRITLSNPTRFQRVNRDRIESTGAEVLAGLVFGADPDRSVTLNGDATLQRIRLFDQTASGAERRPENNPEARGRLELGAPLPAQLRGFAAARHTGTQYCLNGETGNEDRLPARTVGDLGVQRSFGFGGGVFRMLRALVSLDNVGNTAVYDQCGLPQPGRTLRVMLSLR